MNQISKLAIAIVAVALAIVIGLIVLTADKKNADVVTETTTVQPTQQPTQEPTAEPTQAPEEEAQEEAQEIGEMYEGALAGLTQEEIGRLAMAEEQQHSGETGEETADEEGTSVEAVAGVAD